MLNLLNAINTNIFWLLVAQGVLLLIEVAVLAILIIRYRLKNSDERRKLVSITLDTTIVKREFEVGEKCDPSGLIITAHYNVEPLEETLHEYTIVTPELLEKLTSEGRKPEDLARCLIYVPDLTEVGKPTVTVAFKDQTAMYAISVVEPAAKPEPVVEAEPTPEVIVVAAAEEPVEMVDYNITVVAPEELTSLQVSLYNGSEQIGQAVNVENGKATITAPAGEYMVRVYGLPNDDYVVEAELLSSDKLTALVTVGYSEDYYTVEDKEDEMEEAIPTVQDVIDSIPEIELVEYNIVVNAPEGLTALQVALYNGDTQVGDAANVESGAATLTAEEGEYAVRVFGVPEGYIVTEGTVSATRHICTVTITEPVKEAEEELAVAEAAPATAAQEVVVVPAEPVVIVEESFEGGILRYDRSFMARLIQSENELKQWYTDLKNYLLSFKKVHDRISWKRESYRYGREPVAMLGYRGKTLCVYLPLNPNDYAESKYKVEDVSDNASYADTPCMYRIKNARRVKYAMELIDVVMERLSGGARIERDSVDYYVPYEGLVELINKGLIKRNVKSKQDEAFFEDK